MTLTDMGNIPLHTSTIDGFWALLKHGLSGVYHGVSAKHLPSCLNEYVFRYNNREDGRGMFNAMMNRIQKSQEGAS